MLCHGKFSSEHSARSLLNMICPALNVKNNINLLMHGMDLLLNLGVGAALLGRVLCQQLGEGLVDLLAPNIFFIFDY